MDECVDNVFINDEFKERAKTKLREIQEKFGDRDDQALVKTLPSSRVGAQNIYLDKKVIDFGMTKNPWWPVNFLHWVGLRLFQLHAHKNLALGGFYLLLSIRFFCGNLFHFTS